MRLHETLFLSTDAVTAPSEEYPMRFKYFALIPYFFTVCVWVFLFCDHIANFNNIRYQGLGLRITFIFPLGSTLVLCGFFFPQANLYLEIPLAIVEAYMLISFLALIISWAWQHCDAPRVIMEHPVASRPCRCSSTRFANGEAALRHYKWCVIQYMFVKPTMMVVRAIAESLVGEFTHEAKTITLVTAFANVASLLVTARTFFVLIRVFKAEPHRALKGLQATRKIILIKLFFFFLVVNNLLINPLIVNEKIPLTTWFCMDVTKDYCIVRNLAFVLLIEVAIVSIPVGFFYRAKSFQQTTQEGSSGSAPPTHPSKSMSNSRAYGMAKRFGKFHDLRWYLNPPEEYRYKSETAIKEPVAEGSLAKV